MKNKGHSNTNFQNYKKSSNSHKCHQNNHKSGQFTAGTLSFQASQQIKPANDISLNASTIKHFLNRIGEKYTLQKKLNTSSKASNSQDVTVKAVIETATANDDEQIDTVEPANNAPDKEDLPSLLDQYSDLMSSNSGLTIQRYRCDH